MVLLTVIGAAIAATAWKVRDSRKRTFTVRYSDGRTRTFRQ